MGKIRLSDQNRQFFQLVADATFTNPFGTERTEIDQQIAGAVGVTDRKKLIPKVIEAIEGRLATLDENKKLCFQDFAAHDAELMRYTYLFEVYHQCAHTFDEFIQKQQAHGDSPLPVEFGPQIIKELIDRGFSQKDAIQYFAMFYQIRRAFYFIDRGLVGKSDCMRTLRKSLWNNIFTYDIRDYEKNLWDQMEDFSTLLEGATGSGKGAAAAAIGRSGYIPYDPNKKQFTTSFTQTFLPINLSQFAETLLESELFGHTKGAFTGAVGSHDGILSLCQRHGSIFLDEIGEISIPAQVKLLKVLEERTFSPVGSHQKRRFDGRVIAATNQPIDVLRREGKFRDDFYYRLCSDCIHVPPLVQRVQENPHELTELVEHFTRLITGSENPMIAQRATEVIDKRLGKHYLWPGNVRELAQCIRRVILKRDYEGQTAEAQGTCGQLTAGIKAGNLTSDELLNAYCKMLHERFGTYEEVAKLTGLDRRTVKKRVDNPS